MPREEFPDYHTGMSVTSWKIANGSLDLTERCLVMGVLNVTPDSFSDGGKYLDHNTAVARAETLIAEGADILDIGGESSRPGSTPVPAEEQLRRVLPVLRAVRSVSEVPISIDTTLAEVADACLADGASIINDISGLRHDPGMTEVAKRHGAGVVVMHMLGTPATMQDDPRYGDVVGEIMSFFEERLKVLLAAGLERETIAIDPGIGFGKRTEDNLAILRNLDRFSALGQPVLVGGSRKRLIGEVTGKPVEERDAGSLAVLCPGLAAGHVHIVRTHAVAATRDATRMLAALRR